MVSNGGGGQHPATMVVAGGQRWRWCPVAGGVDGRWR